MQTKQITNHRQIAWMVGSVLVTGPLMSLAQSLSHIAKVDAWFSQILPTWYGLVIAYVFAEISRAFPGKNLFEIFYLLTGKWIGALINAVILLYLLMLLIRDVKGITNFIHVTLLPRTPIEIILLLFVLVLLYYGKTSVEVAARVNEMYFPFFLLLTVLLYLFLANEFSFARLEPVLASSLERIFYSNVISVGSYGDLFLFGAFLHTVSNSRLLHASMRHGILIACFSFTLVLINLLAVMGDIVSSRLTYPFYVLVEQIHITDFLDRVEVMLFSVWFPAYAIKVIVTYLAFVIGMSSLVGQQQPAGYNKAVGWILLAASLLSFPRISDVGQFVSYSLPVIVLCVQPPLLLLLYLGAVAKRKRGEGKNEQNEPQAIRQYRLHVTMTNGALAVSLISIIAGVFGTSWVSYAGAIAGGVYMFCLFAALVLTYREMQLINHWKQRQQTASRS